MSENLTAIKTRLREYLQRRGVSYNASKKTWRCHNHDDQSESAVLYENPEGSRLYCPVCEGAGKKYTWDIFEIAGAYEGLHEFRDQLRAVKSALGIAEPEREKRKPEPAALRGDDIARLCDPEPIRKIAADKQWGEIVNSWRYHNLDGDVVGLDVRFQREGERKDIITFWWDGDRVRWSGGPVFVYGLDKFRGAGHEKPVLIHEGAKCAEIGNGNLEHFTSLSWSGGSGKASLADWSALIHSEVYILPDDDGPGIKAAHVIREALPQARIIRPVEAARAIKPKGADIEEILQVMSADEFTAYALDPANHLDVSDAGPTPDNPTAAPPRGTDAGEFPAPPSAGVGPVSEPFKILGMADNEGHFIDAWGYYQHYRLSSLSKNKLNELTDLTFWRTEYGTKRGIDVDEAINYVISRSKLKQFDTRRLKGRGCWRSGDRICYHDGIKTYGDPDPDHIYLKLERRDIGLDADPAGREFLHRIRDMVFGLSFETRTDAVRCMGWTVLAPFAGALQHRPTVMLTGESGTGKTQVQKLFMQPISDFKHYDLRTSSPAGVRRSIGRDSCSVFFDEAGKETDKMKMNFDDMLAFIRSNYSEDSPDSVKASMKDEGVVTYKLNSMFGLATTDPTIENIQDENRMLRVNFLKPRHSAEEWQRIETELKEVLDKAACDSIRALTWRRLRIITDLARKIVRIAKSKTGRDYRSSYADMLLAAAYMVVWCDTEAPEDAAIHDMLDKYYAYQPVEANRNESEEVVERILDEQIEVLHGNRREKLTVAEIVRRIHSHMIRRGADITPADAAEFELYRGALARYGLRLTDDYALAICNRHHQIKRLIDKGAGYSKILKRHPGIVDEQKAVYFPEFGGARRCTVIRDVVKFEEQESEQENFDEQVGEML